MKIVMFYEMAPGAPSQLKNHFPAHRARLDEFHARGVLLAAGPLGNPPQSAILGIHATRERPVAENGQVVIRPMNYLALSYDHRIVDGREAVLSLVAIKEALEDPARLLLDL